MILSAEKPNNADWLVDDRKAHYAAVSEEICGTYGARPIAIWYGKGRSYLGRFQVRKYAPKRNKSHYTHIIHPRTHTDYWMGIMLNTLLIDSVDEMICLVIHETCHYIRHLQEGRCCKHDKKFMELEDIELRHFGYRRGKWRNRKKIYSGSVIRIDTGEEIPIL